MPGNSVNSDWGGPRASLNVQIGDYISAIADINRDGRLITNRDSAEAMLLVGRAKGIGNVQPPPGLIFAVRAGAGSRLSTLQESSMSDNGLWVQMRTAANGLILARGVQAHDTLTTGIEDPKEALLWEFGTAVLDIVKYTPGQASCTSNTRHRLHLGPGAVRVNLKVIRRNKIQAHKRRLHPLSAP